MVHFLPSYICFLWFTLFSYYRLWWVIVAQVKHRIVTATKPCWNVAVITELEFICIKESPNIRPLKTLLYIANKNKTNKTLGLTTPTPFVYLFINIWSLDYIYEAYPWIVKSRVEIARNRFKVKGDLKN